MEVMNRDMRNKNFVEGKCARSDWETRAQLPDTSPHRLHQDSGGLQPRMRLTASPPMIRADATAAAPRRTWCEAEALEASRRGEGNNLTPAISPITRHVQVGRTALENCRSAVDSSRGNPLASQIRAP